MGRGRGDGGVALTLARDPAGAQVPGPARAGEQEGAPVAAPGSGLRRQRAVRQRHRVAARRESTASPPAPGSAPHSPAWDQQGRRAVREASPPHTLPPPFSSTSPSLSCSRHQVQTDGAGQCPTLRSRGGGA